MGATLLLLEPSTELPVHTDTIKLALDAFHVGTVAMRLFVLTQQGEETTRLSELRNVVVRNATQLLERMQANLSDLPPASDCTTGSTWKQQQQNPNHQNIRCVDHQGAASRDYQQGRRPKHIDIVACSRSDDNSNARMPEHSAILLFNMALAMRILNCDERALQLFDLAFDAAEAILDQKEKLESMRDTLKQIIDIYRFGHDEDDETQQQQQDETIYDLVERLFDIEMLLMVEWCPAEAA